ncbi:hypothetical protein PRUPE_1G385600 [Prunus persica]|uniref:Uncharacterized protein n=1 Tax=Prunus persica TaxID=3760 RepID=A0A251R9Z1_PRUPE|nr:hypothetical protein PRUPE_1G385600 [Prunus persica]
MENGHSSKPTESWIWACATVKRNGSCLCRVYVFPFGLVFIGMWTAYSSVLFFLGLPFFLDIGSVYCQLAHEARLNGGCF